MTIRRPGRRSPASRTRASDRGRSLAGLVVGVSRFLHATQTGATVTTSALQTLPDSTLLGVAAGSIGVGAGFYLAGTPRLAIAAGVLPAVVMAAAIVLRPIRPVGQPPTP